MTFEYSVVAVSRTKKQAKQLAAFKMLNRLADVLTLTTSEKDGSSENVCTIVGNLYFKLSHDIPCAAVSVCVFLLIDFLDYFEFLCCYLSVTHKILEPEPLVLFLLHRLEQ
jgi:hypothetical protein